MRPQNTFFYTPSNHGCRKISPAVGLSRINLHEVARDINTLLADTPRRGRQGERLEYLGFFLQALSRGSLHGDSPDSHHRDKSGKGSQATTGGAMSVASHGRSRRLADVEAEYCSCGCAHGETKVCVAKAKKKNFLFFSRWKL